MRQSAEEFLADYVYQILGGATEQLRIRYLIVEEQPVDAILKASETEKVELVVMGTYPRSRTNVALIRLSSGVIRQSR
jgi:nucleotide-binding universal stress UspA family protein